jgi:DNA-binding MarR family transcriptional regulator
LLTEKAKMLSQCYKDVSQQMNNIFYNGLSDEEIRFFVSTLERILANLKGSELVD